MKLLLVLAALAALLVACAAPVERLKPPQRGGCDRTFVISADFPQSEQEALERAAARWNAVAVEQFCVRPATNDERVEDVEHGVFRVQYKGEFWHSLSEKAGGANWIGMHFGDSDRIAVVDSLSDEEFEVVALHELGHAHGLGHVAAPAIMHASIGTANDFTPNDLAECQRVGACLKEDEDG